MILWRKNIHLPFCHLPKEQQGHQATFQVVIQIILRITTLNEFCIFMIIVKIPKIYAYYLVLTDASKYKRFLFPYSESSESDSIPRSTRLRFSPDQPLESGASKA